MQPKTVLFLAANPLQLPALQLGEECRAIEHKIRAAKFRDQIHFRSRWAARPDDLLQALNEDAPSILHFSGHGVGDEGIFFQGEDGAVSVSAEGLSQVIRAAGASVTLVVLNACYSHVQAQPLVADVPCVIGMPSTIGDEGAIIYAASFYRALAFGNSVGNAHRQGLAALAIEPLVGQARDIQGAEAAPHPLAPVLSTRHDIDAESVYIVHPHTADDHERNGSGTNSVQVRTSPDVEVHQVETRNGGTRPIVRMDGTGTQWRSTVKTTEGEPKFTGRDKELRAMERLFCDRRIIVLHGMPGVGKTRLAKEYARANVNAYRGGMFLLSFEEPPPVELAKLLRAMGKPVYPDESTEDQCRRALHDLGSAGPTLLIYDSVADERTLCEWLPYDGLDWHLIVTSTFAHWAPSWSTIEVGVLREPAARALVSTILCNEVAAARLAAPIAAQAAGITVELCTVAAELQARLRRGTQVENLKDELTAPTIASFDAAWELLPHRAQIVLGVVSLLPGSHVPMPLLLSLLLRLGWSTTAANVAIDEVCARSLATADTTSIEVHQRIARFVRDRAPLIEREGRRSMPSESTTIADRDSQHQTDPCCDLSLFIDGELEINSERAATFRTHLGNCEACQDRLLQTMEPGARVNALARGSQRAALSPAPMDEAPAGRGPAAARVRRILPLAAATAIGALAASTIVWRPAVATDHENGKVLAATNRTLTLDASTLSRVQHAHDERRSGNLGAAIALANDLLATPAQADALQILGTIALTQSRLDEAADALERARDLHRAANRRAELARDLQALADLQNRRAHYAEALRDLNECIGESQAVVDRVIEAYCHISAAQVLARVGYFSASQQELDRAEPLLASARDRAWLEAERGNLLRELAQGRVPERYTLSERAFERAREFASSAQLATLSLTSELNLAYAAAEDGRPNEAGRHLEQARILDTNDRYASEREQLAARIAFRGGDLDLAWSLNERMYGTLSSDDERLEVCTMQARIALATNDLTHAEKWARRGIELTERVRDAQRMLEVRSWVFTSQRPARELLFTALARAKNFDAALSVFEEWQGSTLLDAVSRRDPTNLIELRDAAKQLDKVGAWLPAASAAPLMRTAGRDSLTKSLGGADLFALVLADGRLWCITATGGALHMTDLGPYAVLKERIDQFRRAPTDRALGDELGEILLRDNIYRRTSDTLRVILDREVSGLPVAALRRHGTPLIAVRPIVHAPRISEVACVPAIDRTDRAVVLADPVGDLFNAHREADLVASMLGTTSMVGEAATSQALFNAKGSDILHIATHATGDRSAGVLLLHDQAVSALEIAARGLGPSLVVLASCESASSNGGETGGALSTAFLASGSKQVIATLRPVSDAGAHAITARFYEAGGVKDPARVLARIQASFVDTDNTDWPSFAVFGHDVCRTEP